MGADSGIVADLIDLEVELGSGTVAARVEGADWGNYSVVVQVVGIVLGIDFRTVVDSHGDYY